MKHENIPIVVKQFGDTALNKAERKDVRFNCVETLRRIREYCTLVINKYDSSF